VTSYGPTSESGPQRDRGRIINATAKLPGPQARTIQTLTAANTRNVQHLSNHIHRYSLKNVYNTPMTTGLFKTDQKCTDFN
jgi:hypothetical protein